MKKKGSPSAPAQANAAEENEFSLIPNETLMALYADLLQHQASAARSRGNAPHKLSSQVFAAARSGVHKDILPGDTVRMAVKKSGRAALKPRTGSGFQTTADLIDVLGAAIGNKTRKNAKVAVVWATGADPETLRMAFEAARAHRLPVVFVLEFSSAAEETRVEELLNRGVAPGDEMPHIAVDGNDVVAVYRVAHEAIERARRDRGPTLIECIGFRVKGQPAGRHLDPVANMERYLRGKGLLTRKVKQEMLSQVAAKKKLKA